MLEPGQVIQWWLPTINSEYKDSSFCPSCPHFPTRYAPFSIPHSTHCKDWVVSFKFLKWITGFGKTSVTAKKSDYSSTRGVNGCFDVKSSSMLLFTAVESQLMEKQDCFHFSHTVRWKNQLGVVVTTDTIVWLLNIQTDRGGDWFIITLYIGSQPLSNKKGRKYFKKM